MPKPSNPQICITLAGKSEAELLENLAEAQKLHDFVELRLDFLPEVRPEFLIELRKKLKGRGVVTCRATRDGGEFQGTDEEQLEILYQASDLGFDFIDVDLRLADKFLAIKNKPDYVSNTSPLEGGDPKGRGMSGKQEIDNNSVQNGEKSKVIASYHHFSHTPGYLQLRKILKKMRASGADIYKFACQVESEKDLHSLYKLLINKKPSEEIIVLGMGKVGQISRVVSPLLGGFLTFASLGDSVASGQFGFEEIQKKYRELGLWLTNKIQGLYLSEPTIQASQVQPTELQDQGHSAFGRLLELFYECECAHASN